jgi:hypothetical protein
MNSNAELNVIASLDLTPIKVKLMHKESGEGWSQSQVDAVELEYRRFLHLLKLFPDERVAPQFDVDIFWHYHILDTMKYAADCEQIFGYFLHHSPYSELGGEEDEASHQRSGARMQELYEMTFGAASMGREEGHSITESSQPVAAKTAWCLPATTKTAWCLPATTKTAWCLPAKMKTAWCLPATPKNAWSLRAASMKASPQGSAQNGSRYSGPVLALAA